MQRPDQPTLGVDLGGTKILAGVVSEDGAVLSSHRRETQADRGFNGVLNAVAEAVDACLQAHDAPRPDLLGIGVAGQVDDVTGTVRFAPNLDWHDEPLGTTLAERLGLDVVVVNDVRAASWGEWKHGAGRGVADLVVVFLGTGVGGGVVSGGALVEGCSNAAGELGHTMLVAGGRRCRCPNRGCLEAYVGGWAVAERAREAIAADPEAGAGLVERAGAADTVTGEHVTDGWRAGDPLATRIHEETVSYLAAGLVGIANAVNPCRIVLGGGVIESVPELVDAVRGALLDRPLAVVADALDVVRAALGSQAGVIGAASYARHRSDGTAGRDVRV